MCGMLRCIFRISVAENRSDNLGCRSELGSDPPPTAVGKSLGLHTVHTVCQTRKSLAGKSFKTRLTGDFYNHTHIGASHHLAPIANAMPHETKNPRNIICNNYRLVKFGPQSPIVAGCIVAPVYILAQLSLWSSVQGFLVIANFVFHGNLHPLCTRAPEEDMSRPWFGPMTSCTAGEH